jgi:hypothetical protein
MEKEKEKETEKDNIIKCPFNKNHLISTFKIIPHIHKCKDGKGKIDKLLKCKNNPVLMFFNKEEHSKDCKKCYKFYYKIENKIEIENENENYSFSEINKYKKNNKNLSDSYSLITANFGENNEDISFISSKSDLKSFMKSDISSIVIENKRNNKLKNKEISDIDFSNISRKI